jgi:hypothetical protein
MKLHRLIALLIIFVLVFSTTACSQSNDSWLTGYLSFFGQGQAGGGNLTANQLAQKIADAVRNDSNVTDAFNTIPDRQRDGLSLDEFQQYVRFLRRGVAGAVTSFSEMTTEETEKARQKVLDRLPEQEEQLADLAGFWIHFQERENFPGQIGIYVRQPQNQAADLYSDWVRRILELKDLAALYFDALERHDQAALAFLLETVELPEKVVQIRAGRLIDFYSNNITSRSAEFKLTHAEIDSIGFEEFGIINPDKSQSVSRKIELMRRPGGGFFIDDILPEVMQPEDQTIFFQNQQLMQIGFFDSGEPVQVQSGDLESIIGPPLLHDDTVCVTTGSGVQRLNLQYASALELRAEGSCFRHSRWSGQIKFLRLENPDTSLGSGLRPGDTKDTLLQQYPFAEEAGFIIRSQLDRGSIKLRFIMEDEKIAAIELTVN